MSMKIKAVTMAKIVVCVMAIVILSIIALYFVLKNTPEHYIHNMRGATNTVWVHEDGREAVFDENDELVENHFNQGSYNYANSKKSPFGHFVLDTFPWLLWGSSPDDPTSFSERGFAYFKDLILGLRITVGFGPSEPAKSTVKPISGE